MFTSSLIQKAYQITANSDAWDKKRYEQEVAELLQFNKDNIKANLDQNKRADLVIPLQFSLGVLEDTNAVFFPFMPQEDKNKLIRDLQVTYLLLLAQKQYEIEHQKTENIKEYDRQLTKCGKLLDQLLYDKLCKEKQQQPAPELGHGSEDQPVAYLGLFAGFGFAEQMVALTDRKTKTIREGMGWVNEKRLYWVWGSSFLKTMLGLLPDNFFNSDQAQQVIRIPDPYTGAMSWGLYYFRFALNLGLLLKHTIKGPWMSETEKSEPWTDRFKTQWEQRKFTLLNDSVWATGNLLCFFWLVGKGAAGTWGDMLTIALLVFDITLAVWEYEEERVKHNKQMLDYNEAIARLTREIDTQTKIKNDSDKSEEERRKAANDLIELNLQRQALERAQSKCAREWNHQKINLAVNISYAVGLMLAFVLLAAPFFPLPAATIAAITISGAVLCFALSVITNAIKGGLEIHKTKMTVKELKEEREHLIKAFKSLSPDDENGRKLKFLEVKKLMVETEYQEKMITLQTMKLMRSILLEALIPALIFVSLVFLPLGAGIGVLAAAVTLAVATHFLINALFKAEKEEIKELNPQEYQAFCADPDNWNHKGLKSPSLSLFQSVATEETSIVHPETELVDDKEHSASIVEDSPPLEDENQPLLSGNPG